MESSTVQIITVFVFAFMMLTLCLLKGYKKETSPLCCFCRCFKTAKKVHEADKKREMEQKSQKKYSTHVKGQTRKGTNFISQTNSDRDIEKVPFIAISTHKKSPLKVTFEDLTNKEAKYFPLCKIENTCEKALPSTEKIHNAEKQKMRILKMILKEEEQTSLSADCIYCIA